MRYSTSQSVSPVLSKTAEYALRALLVLAREENSRPVAAEVIARLTGMPANYLGKTLYTLARSGLLKSSRGPQGGFSLAADPKVVTVAQIADVFAEAPVAPRCLLGTGPCDSRNPCDAHENWKRVQAEARAPLQNTTVADLLRKSTSPAKHPTTPSGPAGVL